MQDHLPTLDPGTEAEILVQTSDNKGISMVRPVRAPKPVGADLERMGPEPDKKQMACMAGIYTDPANPRTPQQIIDALSRIPTPDKRDRIDPGPCDPRYFAAKKQRDDQGSTVGLFAEEQAQQWMTTNAVRRHEPGQKIVVLHDGQP